MTKRSPKKPLGDIYLPAPYGWLSWPAGRQRRYLEFLRAEYNAYNATCHTSYSIHREFYPDPYIVIRPSGWSLPASEVPY